MTSAMEVYATLTCVQFVPYTDEDDYVNITSGDGCWSYMGRQGGAQVVSVEKGYCTSEGTTMHELNHALGFVHEQSRSDRDNYVNIMYQYISPDVCSSLLTDAKGTVTSANYPSPYPNNAKCVWVIQAPSDLVTLTFSAFNLQSAPNCASDYIRVYDGRTRTSPLLLDRTCGSKRVPALIASSSMMLVEFVGSKNLKATGFSASYSTVKCGGTYFTPSRNITSPGYPKNYPPNSNCSYIITAPASHKVSLSKISFYTQNSHTCSYDYLSVYDGTSTNAPLLKTFCGPLFTLSATSTGQNMFLRFISDQTEQAPGFVLTYSFGGY
uniref:Metalloendopeptidase n=1 Tax=Xenopus tropicalis TaxID=8364 RepID=A0A1B8XZE4_XENTR